jgi:hypothetical protein
MRTSQISTEAITAGGAGSHLLLRRFPAIASLEYSSERKKEECSGATAAERGKEGKAEEDEAVRRSTT